MLDFEAIEISETISSIDGWVEMSMGEWLSRISASACGIVYRIEELFGFG